MADSCGCPFQRRGQAPFSGAASEPSLCQEFRIRDRKGSARQPVHQRSRGQRRRPIVEAAAGIPVHFILGGVYRETVQSKAPQGAVGGVRIEETVEENVTGVVVAHLESIAQKFSDRHHGPFRKLIAQRTPGVWKEIPFIYFQFMVQPCSTNVHIAQKRNGLMEFHHAHHRVSASSVNGKCVFPVDYERNSDLRVGRIRDFSNLRFQRLFRPERPAFRREERLSLKLLRHKRQRKCRQKHCQKKILHKKYDFSAFVSHLLRG